MLVYHAVFLALVVGTTAFFAVLAALNVRYAERTVRERAEWLADTGGVEDPDRLLDYHRLGTAASQLQSVVVLAFVLLVLYSGLFGGAVEWTFDVVANDLLAGVLLFVGAVVALQVLSLPFDAADTFGVEEAFGFNEQSPQLFARDKLVGTAVAVVFTAILGGGVLLAVEWFPAFWWLAATGVVVAFLLASQVLVPRVVMPLFYDFDPIEDGSLRDAVEDVFERAGFTCDQVYVMNASSRSSHSNAFFTGFGRTKRVVSSTRSSSRWTRRRSRACSPTNSPTGRRGTSGRTWPRAPCRSPCCCSSRSSSSSRRGSTRCSPSLSSQPPACCSRRCGSSPSTN